MSEYSCLWLYFHFWPKNMKSTWYLRFVLYAPRSTVQCVAVDIILIEASRLAISAFISWMSPSTLLISWLHFLKIIHTSKNHRSQTFKIFSDTVTIFSTFNFLPNIETVTKKRDNHETYFGKWTMPRAWYGEYRSLS